MQANSYTTGSQLRPDVDVNGQGDVVVTWTSSGSVGDDDDVLSVQAQRFRIVGSFGGTVWLDDDNNGIFSPDESRLPGVEVELFDSLDVSLGTVTTDAGGTYLSAASGRVPTERPSSYPPARCRSLPRTSATMMPSIAMSMLPE